MAKNFPYFKFIATDWMTGDIVFEDLKTQGLFINICALYWQRGGLISVFDLQKRFKNIDELNNLIGTFLVEKDGQISIDFLDEQLNDANHVSLINRANGAKGGRPKKTEEKPTANRPLTDRKAKKSQEEEEEEVNKNKNIKEKEKEKEKNYRAFAHLSISESEFFTLNQTYPQKLIDEVLDQIENYSQNKKYKSLFLTAKNWLKKETKNLNQNQNGNKKPNRGAELAEYTEYILSRNQQPDGSERHGSNAQASTIDVTGSAVVL
jgi:hypothetical protein